MTILEALRDRNLLGGLPAFRDLSTWRAWITFLAAFYGLPLEPEEVGRFKRHTGRSEYAPPAGGWREAAAITGRQSGKSRVAGLAVAFEAMFSEPEPDGMVLFALAIAQDARSSMRTLLRYAVAPFDNVEILRPLVKARTAETLELSTGMTLAAYPCRPHAVRGLRARFAALDELAFYVGSEGNPTDREMLRAVRPCLATTGGRLLILSSPYGQSGALWDLHRQHFGRDDSPLLVWQATAPEMNPTLPADYIARMREDDPEAFRSEVLGEFRSGVSSLFDPAAIEACVVSGRRELAPMPEVSYRGFADPSGGRSDAFTVAIGHKADGRVVIDLVRAWAPPFNPSGVVAEAAEILKSYSVRSVTGDRYAGEWPREAFRSEGIAYELAAENRSDLYLALLPSVNAEAVELPDVPELLRELRGLERRRGSSGKDRVDHRPGSHDDRANAVAGLVRILSGRSAGKVIVPARDDGEYTRFLPELFEAGGLFGGEL